VTKEIQNVPVVHHCFNTGPVAVAGTQKIVVGGEVEIGKQDASIVLDELWSEHAAECDCQLKVTLTTKRAVHVGTLAVVPSGQLGDQQ